MSEKTGTIPPWVWVAGGLVLGLAVAAWWPSTTTPPTQVAAEVNSPSNDPQVLAELKKLNQRLNRLESERAAVPKTIVVERGAPSPNLSGESARIAVSPSAGGQYVGTQTPAPTSVPDAKPEGVEFASGVKVVMNPTVPAAKDPIPPGVGDSSQDYRLIQQQVFPEGCPTCDQ